MAAPRNNPVHTPGLIPLEIRFKHDPNSAHGYVGAALSSNVIHFTKVRDSSCHTLTENQRHSSVRTLPILASGSTLW